MRYYIIWSNREVRIPKYFTYYQRVYRDLFDGTVWLGGERALEDWPWPTIGGESNEVIGVVFSR